MLRAIQSPHLRGEILVAQATTTATPSATINKQPGDFVSVTRNSAGKLTLIPKVPRVTPPVVVASVGTGATAGDYVGYDTDPTSAAIVAQYRNAAGTAAEGTANLLMFQRGNACLDRVDPLQSVKNTAKAPRILVARIASDGTVVIGKRDIVSVSKASSVYTITLRKAFGRVPIGFVTPYAGAQKAATITGITASTVTVATFSSAEAAQDNNFDLFLFGWDASQEQWGMDRVVQIGQLKPRIEVFRISGSGTASLAVGALDGSLTDNGTGDYTITFTKRFGRAPVVVTTAKSGRSQLLSAASVTSVNVGSFNAAGSATDDDISVIVLGFDGPEC